MASTTHPEPPAAHGEGPAPKGRGRGSHQAGSLEAGTPKSGTTAARRPGRRRAAWWLIPSAVVILLVTAHALSAYVPPDLHTSRIPPRSELHYALLVAHIFTAAVAVITGIAQFWPWLRRRHPVVHRWTGRTYFFAGVFPSALVGIPVVWFIDLGLSNQMALGVLDVLWITTGIAGYRSALQRRYADHRVWMIRNFALTLVAITSRLLQPLIEQLVAAQQSDPIRYAGNPVTAAHDLASTTAWLALVLNMVAAEWWIQRQGYRLGRRRR
ncbi:DUF2306 domain-containing protein [Streptomyces sp. NPDC050636]|uniref:DUF2306 domain-containing protein n=1 Tax=Streptomyces sp. NPDC050636 TaxID=3154510 RepID=UPI0034433BE9